MNAREAAFFSLVKCENRGSYSNIETDTAIKKYGLVGAEKNLYTALVYGCIERKITIDYIISALSSKKLSEIDSNVLVLIRMGIYQLTYLDRIPESAACNEAVAIAKKKCKSGSSGFVNAILREYLRQEKKVVYPDKNKFPAEYLSVYYSYPLWMAKMFTLDFGFGKAERLLSAMNKKPYITLRVNTLKVSVDEYIKLLEEKKIKYSRTRFSKWGINLKQNVSVYELPGYEEGLFFVQDEASQICVSVLGAKPDETVIDTCSCPGGKSFSAAISMENKGKVYSFDLHANKLSLVEKGANKLGIDIIETAERNGTQFSENLVNLADRIICDVPCSGLGTIAKKPDLRQKEEKDIEKLPDIQIRILENASKYLKAGGILVYSTCTVNPRENSLVVENFLEDSDEFSLSDFSFGDELKSENGMLTLYPDEHSTDGFFICKLQKRK